MRGATHAAYMQMQNTLFQSTLLMRGATDLTLEYIPDNPISIHAPHARSDAVKADIFSALRDFNPRSSCEERQDKGVGEIQTPGDFNPRSSCEERLSDSQALQVAGF